MKKNNAVFITLGASNHSVNERQKDDFYATDSIAVQKLLDVETFNPEIWECAVGQGHIAKVLSDNGYKVKSSDVVDRGYPGTKLFDFLNQGGDKTEPFKGDIITNPPYKYAKEFVEMALCCIPKGNKVAMLLKIQFLESKKRQELFKKNPPEYVYVFVKRTNCAKDGLFENCKSSAICYCWFVWRKGFNGEPKIRWI